jgi:hypothetical protein
MTKLILGIFLLLSFTNCAHGPQVTVCSSYPPTASFNCSNKSGPVASVTYAAAAAAGYSAYQPQSEQSLLDYCENRNTQGVEPPQFAKCSIDMAHGGFDCITENCEVNGFQNGLVCTDGASSFVAFSASTNYLAFSPADNQTLIDYCNISLTHQ